MKQIYYKNIVCVLNNFATHSELENIIHCWVIPKEEVLKDIISKLTIKPHIFVLTCSEQKHTERIQADTNPRRKETQLGSSIENLKTYKGVNYTETDTSELSAKQVAEIIAKGVIK